MFVPPMDTWTDWNVALEGSHVHDTWELDDGDCSVITELMATANYGGITSIRKEPTMEKDGHA